MVFSSLEFLIYFLPIFFICYFIIPENPKYFRIRLKDKLKSNSTSGRNFILFIASLFFYAWGEPIYIAIMILSTIVDYVNGLLIERCYDKPKRKKLFLICSIIINLFLLGFFKYGDFVIGNLNELFLLNIPLLKVKLPIGISFYTFQTMSYSIDVYRGNCKAQKNIINFGAYVTMFPQLIAGPIVRYVTVNRELDSRKITLDQFYKGVVRFIVGLCKKVLLANTIGGLWKEVGILEINELSVLSSWIGIFAFGLQIYFDFSGYSDMAIGLGKMLGFSFNENFNYPYISKSITEFWRRWHISLGTWFREYVYIPLGGNKVSRKRHIVNLLMVWTLTGFWHGASWNFLLWGVYFGILLIMEKYVIGNFLEKLPNIIRVLYTLMLVLFGWVLFESDNIIVSGVDYFGSMFDFSALYNLRALFLFNQYWLLLIIGVFFATPVMKNICYMVKVKYIRLYSVSTLLLTTVGLLVCIAYITASTYNPFLYFRF